MYRRVLRKVLSLAIAFSLVTIAFMPPQALAETASEFKIHCMSRMMYAANRRRSEITENAASTACQNATTAEQSMAISDCVKDVMYNSSNNLRDGMTAPTAATVCQKARTAELSQKISQCMRETMYDSRGRLQAGVTPAQALKKCSLS